MKTLIRQTKWEVYKAQLAAQHDGRVLGLVQDDDVAALDLPTWNNLV